MHNRNIIEIVSCIKQNNIYLYIYRKSPSAYLDCVSPDLTRNLRM